MKNPVFLAFLDFVTLGLGTVILGKRRGWGAAMFFGASFLRYEEIRIAPAVTGVVTIHWAFMLVGMTAIGLAMAMDVYKAASPSGLASTTT